MAHHQQVSMTFNNVGHFTISRNIIARCRSTLPDIDTIGCCTCFTRAAAPVCCSNQCSIRVNFRCAVACNIVELPVVIISRIFRNNFKTQGAGAIAGKRVPKGIFIFIIPHTNKPAARGRNGVINTVRHCILYKQRTTTNRESRGRCLPFYTFYFAAALSNCCVCNQHKHH